MQRLTLFSIDHPRLTGAVLFALTSLFAAGIAEVRYEHGYRVLVGSDHPGIQRLDRMIERFGGGLPVKIVWGCGAHQPCEHALDSASLEMAHAVAEALRAREGVARVGSPADAALLVGQEDGFSVRRFYEGGRLVPDAGRLIATALEDPLWQGEILSRDGQAAAILVQPVDTLPQTERNVIASIEEALGPARARGFAFHLVGDSHDALAAQRELSASQNRLIPVTVLGIGLVIALLLRPVSFVLMALLSTGVALLWTYGAMGWLRWPQDGISEVLPPMLLAIGVCDSVHLLSVHARRRAWSAGSRSAWREAAAEVSLPCVLTTLTTAAAFLSFLSSGLDTFVRFGTLAAFGAVACLVLTFTLLPLLATAFPPKRRERDRLAASWESGLEALVETASRHRRLILSGSLVATACLAIGWTWLRVDNDWLATWGEDSSVVRSIRFTDRHLGPTETLEIALTLPPDAELVAPETLAVVRDVEAYVAAHPEVSRVTSVTTLLDRLHRLLHGDAAFERPTDDPAANAELLELLAFEDPELLDSWITLGGDVLRVSAQAQMETAQSNAETVQGVRSFLAERLPPGWDAELSGAFAMNADWVEDVQRIQVRSFPIAFLLVSVLIGVMLRSPRFAAMAMLPTLVPVVATVGTLGWLGIHLDIGSAMIAAIILGIAVDDAIHLLVPFQRELARSGDAPTAMRYAMRAAGRSIVTSSLALSLGFLSLTLSSWQSISNFGFLASIAILIALVADLLILPALVLWLAERGEVGAPRVVARLSA